MVGVKAQVGWEMTKHIKDVVFPFIKDIHDGRRLFFHKPKMIECKPRATGKSINRKTVPEKYVSREQR